MLKKYIEEKRKEKDILLMTHIVIGYPDYESSFKIVEAMVEAGVDIMELQIPFSEPLADGPVILKANQKSLELGTTVKKSIEFGREMAKKYDIPFLYMSYYNILYKYGVTDFAKEMDASGLKGAIVPDLPPEEGDEYITSMKNLNLSPIYIYSPNTTDDRMKYISSFADGFIYCVARKGVTGSDTEFSDDITTYLERCRNATDLPLAVGFGVKDKKDIDFLKGKADIAVIGSETIRLVESEGVSAIKPFIEGLR